MAASVLESATSTAIAVSQELATAENDFTDPDHTQPPGVVTTPVGDPWPRPYYLEDGLRKVTPYHYTYNTNCKERWRGRKLIEIFQAEFRDRPLEYYRKAMESGAVMVNAAVVGPDYVVRNGDKITHTAHRHEPPVTADPIGIIHEDDGMLVINKPAGIPVHPTGRYKYNSLTEILKSERGPHFLPHPCHRLDRLTSGIMLIGKTPEATVRMTDQIKERSVRKEYLARVIGKFPDGEIVCDQPILQISPKLGLNRVRANGKPARTVFKRLAYYVPQESKTFDAEEQQVVPDHGEDGQRRLWSPKHGYSIVRCLPLTGRTHQIRVHLQFLGHPIANDPIYANRRVWGISLGYNDTDGSQDADEDVISRLSRMGKEDVADAVAYYDEMVDQYHKKKAERLTGELCSVCAAPLYSDPGERELSIWLHSVRYEDQNGNWAYLSPLPAWALPPTGESGPEEVGGIQELIEAVKDEISGTS
jgi:tRNA pseudouridine32 synthase